MRTSRRGSQRAEGEAFILWDEGDRDAGNMESADEVTEVQSQHDAAPDRRDGDVPAKRRRELVQAHTGRVRRLHQGHMDSDDSHAQYAALLRVGRLARRPR